MKYKLITTLLLLLTLVAPCQGAYTGAGVNNSTSNFSVLDMGNYPLVPLEDPDLTGPIPHGEGDTFSEFDAGAGMVGEGVWNVGPTIAANSIYETFGATRGFILSFINYNVNPEKIPIAKDYNDKNQNLAVILAILFIIGESLASSMATVDYPTYKNVFGDSDILQKRGMGGGVAMIAGLGAAWIFRGIMILIDLIDMYLMLQVMDAIKPSLDNGVMYLFMAIIELCLFGFFLYRQILIGAMYIASPIYGVLWASGYLKEFVDAIGDKFIRALIMQPLCIFITVVSIALMKSVEWTALGFTVWDADSSAGSYIFLSVFLLMACIWCLFSKFTIIKRAAKMLVFKKVV